MDVLHFINILFHVIFGSIALLIGFCILIYNKGGLIHKQLGSFFLMSIGVVIVTAVFGIFLFSLNQFLLVISVISGYEAFSGYRVIRNKFTGPLLVDHILALIVLIIGFVFLIYFKKDTPDWSPIIIYSTLGWLFFIGLYDLFRMFLSPAFLHRIYLYEHIVKLVGAFSAISSAFLGTILPNYQPYSQLIPTILGFIIIIFMCIRYGSLNHATVK